LNSILEYNVLMPEKKNPSNKVKKPVGPQHQSQNEVTSIFYDISRRPQNKRRRVSLPPGSKLVTPSGGKVPPAWTEVWVTTDPGSPIQAIGRDSKGRKVYLYSTDQMGRANAAKFSRMRAFARVYPRLVRKIGSDKDKSEEAFVLYLISKTGFRIGSEEETQAQVKAFGASTLRCSHVAVTGDKVEFDFTAKKGVRVNKTLKDSFLAGNLSRRCGQDSDQKIFKTSEYHIRNYLRSVQHGDDFEVKDFRTYLATTVALRQIKKLPLPQSDRQYKKLRKEVAVTVARELGNTARIALKSYIPPEVFCRWAAGLASDPSAQSRAGSTASDFMQCIYYDQDVTKEEYQDNDPLERNE
jgi:DNA topoisomerase-1